VLVGGNGPRVLDRVLAYGDEWQSGVDRVVFWLAPESRASVEQGSTATWR
jgi:hypothetical protein